MRGHPWWLSLCRVNSRVCLAVRVHGVVHCSCVRALHAGIVLYSLGQRDEVLKGKHIFAMRFQTRNASWWPQYPTMYWQMKACKVPDNYSKRFDKGNSNEKSIYVPSQSARLVPSRGLKHFVCFLSPKDELLVAVAWFPVVKSVAHLSH